MASGKARGKKTRAQLKRRDRQRIFWGISLGGGALVLGVVLVVAGAGLMTPSAQAAPAWVATTTEGEKVSSDDLKGSVYVMDFFFLSCGICEIQLPKNRGVVEALADREDFKFISVTADPADTVPRIKAHQEEENATWPHVRDTFGLYQKFKVRGNPNLVFVDRDGNIALTVTQIADTEYLLDQALRLLGGEAPTDPKPGQTQAPEHPAPAHATAIPAFLAGGSLFNRNRWQAGR